MTMISQKPNLLTGAGIPTCPYCDNYHPVVCPRIKALTVDHLNNITRIELHDPEARPAQTVSLTADDLHALKARQSKP